MMGHRGSYQVNQIMDACQSFHSTREMVVESGAPFPQWIIKMGNLPDGESALLLSDADCLESGFGGSVLGASCG